ncbi:MAG: long-chain fatty acid--CoA ligase [Inquilinus sp.]|nr:long-chain fatty acid--CoA ligase [Inquilinus sp.]
MRASSPERERAAPHPWLAHYPKDIDWHAALPEAPLHAVLDEAAARYRKRPFLDFLGRKCTYGEAGAIVEKLAGAFQEMGVGRGVKVGLLLPNCPQFVFCFFAVLKAGGTAVLYNPLRAEKEIAQQIEDSETDVMVTVDIRRIHSKIAHVLPGSRLKRIVVCRFGRSLPWSKRILFSLTKGRERIAIPRDGIHVPFERLLRHSHKVDPPKIDPRRDIAALIYTGGTTGTPKGVCLSHANLYANLRQTALGLPSAVPGKERVLAVIPFFHAFGMTAVLNAGIALGAEILVLPRFDLWEVLRTVRQRRPTILPAVPTVFAAVASQPNGDRPDLSSLRLCTCGGDTLPSDIRQSFRRLAGCDLFQGYGLSECSPVVTGCAPSGLDKPGSIGVPVPGTEVEIVSLEDSRTPLAPGEKGEICVRGPQVMMGYWKRPDATAQVLREGWLHTGDIGFMDEDGYFYVVDRLKDLVITGGYNVYPSVVEAAIQEHPAVREVAVVGLPDPHWGQQVTAFVVPAADRAPSQDELLDFLKDKLSSYEMPKSVRFLKELPKSMIGKVLKAQFRQTYRVARHD